MTKISAEDFQSLLQRKTTAEKTAKSFPGGLEYYNQIQLAYNNSDWQWLSDLCSGVVAAKEDYEQKSIPNARQTPTRELTPSEILSIAHRRKKAEQDELDRLRMGYRPR